MQKGQSFNSLTRQIISKNNAFWRKRRACAYVISSVPLG
jgi:hypothetical protein